ncbi:MAG: hypothetical protein P1P85_03295 [Patescibacteria group bacterium]|nr:hypothetical protein [Patescibacteria group bacterium]
MKKKTKKNKINKNKNYFQDTGLYFEIILMIIIIPLFSFFVITVFNQNNNIIRKVIIEEDVKIMTDKVFYIAGDEIKLLIENVSEKPIYFEPCEYLNKFEKRIEGRWKKVLTQYDEKKYDELGFKTERRMTNCNIKLETKENGIFRVAVRVYYDCEKPGEEMCKYSKMFYSNEFEVL